MKKRILSILLVLTMVAAMVPAFVITGTAADSQSWYDDNPDATTFEIKTAEELIYFSTLIAADTSTSRFAGKTVKLMNDIDLNEGWSATSAQAPTTNLWGATADTARFGGTFDGQNHTISGIYLKSTKYNVGIFGRLENGTVQNLVLANSYIEGFSQIGAISGLVTGTSAISNVYSTAYVKSNCTSTNGQAKAGGLLGVSTGTVTIQNCVFAGTVDGTKDTGGLALRTFGGLVGCADLASSLRISNSAFYGTVSAKSTQVGGTVGLINNVGASVSVSDCIIAGNISGTMEYAGSVFGQTAWGTRPSITLTNFYYTKIDGSAQPFPTYNDTTSPAPSEHYKNEAECHVIDDIATFSANGKLDKFIDMPEGYPMPITLVNTVWAQSSTATSYGGYQKGTSAENDGEIRLIGVVDVATDLESEFSAVGFDIEMILGNGNTWTNKTEGTAPVIYNLYTSVETDKGTATAETLEGDYIFVATVNGINSEYTGDITFVVKTFHDDANGNRVYDDIHVIAYQAAANA